MHDGQIAVLDALQRVQRFLNENAVVMAREVDLTTIRKWHDEVTAILTAYATDQDVSDRLARLGTVQQQHLRMRLRREHMQPIAVIARLTLNTAPEFGAFQMPAWGLRGEAFIGKARTMVDAARKYRETFRKFGLPLTFLDDFRSAIDEVELAISDRELNRARRGSATHGLRAAVREGRAVLRLLDALVRQATADNESLWNTWQAARLVRGRSGKGRGDDSGFDGVSGSDDGRGESGVVTQ